MALVVVRVFSDLQEAQVAASALRAAGLNPVLPDLNMSAVDWIAQQAIGGIRLLLPEGELADAAVVLADCRDADDRPTVVLKGTDALRGAGGLGLGIVAPGIGWMLARRRPLTSDFWIGVALSTAAVVISLTVLMLLVSTVTHRPVFAHSEQIPAY